jgi:hypothetical protein
MGDEVADTLTSSPHPLFRASPSFLARLEILI